MKHATTVEANGIGVLSGRIGPAKCLCYRGWDAMWTATAYGAECSHCGEQRRLGSAPEAILLLPCRNCDAKETTWFASTNGDRVCSCCGEKR